MNQTYLQSTRALLDSIAKEIALELKKPGIIRPNPKTKSGDVAVKAPKKELHRYGVRLTQDGENMVYHYIQMIAMELRNQDPKLDDFFAKREATDLMGEYVLKMAYETAGIPFESTYEEKIRRRELYLKIKLFGVLVFILFFAVIIIGSLT